MKTKLHRSITPLVALLCALCGQSTARAEVDWFDFKADYVAGSKDPNGNMRRGTEVMRLAEHDGKRAAGDAFPRGALRRVESQLGPYQRRGNRGLQSSARGAADLDRFDAGDHKTLETRGAGIFAGAAGVGTRQAIAIIGYADVLPVHAAQPGTARL